MSIQLSIKTPSGSLTTLSIEPSKTVGEVKKLVSEKNPSLSTDSTLIFEKTSLDDSKTLSEYRITSDSTLYIASMTSTSTTRTPELSPAATSSSPAKRSRKRCTVKSCISAPLRGVGDCVFCEGHFCSKHRLLEQHDCVGLQNCKQQLHERNAVKLHQQQTVANKV